MQAYLTNKRGLDMRLQTRYSKPKSKPSGEVKKKNKEKASGLCKNYKSMQHYLSTRLHKPLSKLTYGMIDGHTLESIEIPGNTIETPDSWTGLIVFLIANIIENNGKEALKLMADNGVTKKDFIVDKIYGKYDFERKEQLKVYKIYDTGYYIEADFNVENIFCAILGIMKICRIAIDDISFNMINKRFIEKLGDFSIIDEDESIVTISVLADELKAGKQLVEIFVFGDRIKTDSISTLLWVFCCKLAENYNDSIIMTLGKYKNTGISMTENLENVNYMQIKNSSCKVFTDNKDKDIMKFIENSCNKLDIGVDELKFKIRKPTQLSFRYER